MVGRDREREWERYQGSSLDLPWAIGHVKFAMLGGHSRENTKKAVI